MLDMRNGFQGTSLIMEFVFYYLIYANFSRLLIFEQ